MDIQKLRAIKEGLDLSRDTSPATRHLKWLLLEMMDEKSSKPPTTESRTRTYPLDVDSREVETDDITQQTPASSQLGRAGTESGRVELYSTCAHENRLWLEERANTWQTWWCKTCGALWRSGKILVPVAAPHSSTSARQGLNKSAESLAEESVTSRSAWLNDVIQSIVNLKDFEPKSESDKGYQMGIDTAQAFLQMHARKLATPTESRTDTP